MKISGVVIQTRNIAQNDKDTFEATYKGCSIRVSSDHGFGEAKLEHLTRFNIDVEGKDGDYLVETYEDFHNIRDAIRHALIGACLIPDPNERYK